MYAAQFSPFWNEIIKSLREEDYISNRQVASLIKPCMPFYIMFLNLEFNLFFIFREMDLLSMPSNTGSLRLVQWPLFLLSSKVNLTYDNNKNYKQNMYLSHVNCVLTLLTTWSDIFGDRLSYRLQGYSSRSLESNYQGWIYGVCCSGVLLQYWENSTCFSWWRRKTMVRFCTTFCLKHC